MGVRTKQRRGCETKIKLTLDALPSIIVNEKIRRGSYFSPTLDKDAIPPQIYYSNLDGLWFQRQNDKVFIVKSHKIADRAYSGRGRILTTISCFLCTTELLIVELGDRMVWQPRYVALDIEFEDEINKYYDFGKRHPSLDWEIETMERLGYSQKVIDGIKKYFRM